MEFKDRQDIDDGSSKESEKDSQSPTEAGSPTRPPRWDEEEKPEEQAVSDKVADTWPLRTLPNAAPIESEKRPSSVSSNQLKSESSQTAEEKGDNVSHQVKEGLDKPDDFDSERGDEEDDGLDLSRLAPADFADQADEPRSYQPKDKYNPKAIVVGLIVLLVIIGLTIYALRERPSGGLSLLPPPETAATGETPQGGDGDLSEGQGEALDLGRLDNAQSADTVALPGKAADAADFSPTPETEAAARRPLPPKATNDGKAGSKKSGNAAKASEAKTAAVKTSEPKATATKAAETKPAEPKAIEKNKAAESKPAEAKAVEKKPAEANHTDKKASATKAAESKTAEAKPAEPMVSETKTAESKPVEPKGTETKIAEAIPAEPKTSEAKATEVKAAVDPKDTETIGSELNAGEAKVAETRTVEPKSAETVITEAKVADTTATDSKTGENSVLEISDLWVVNISSTPDALESLRLLNRVTPENVGGQVYFYETTVDGRTQHRIRIGFFDSKEKAEAVGQSVKERFQLTATPWAVRPTKDEVQLYRR